MRRSFPRCFPPRNWSRHFASSNRAIRDHPGTGGLAKPARKQARRLIQHPALMILKDAHGGRFFPPASFVGTRGGRTKWPALAVLLPFWFFTAASSPAQTPGPIITALVNAATNKSSSSVPATARGSLVSIIGSNLAAGSASSTGFPLPMQLRGTQVLFGGIPAPLLSVSPTQIEAQVPFELPDVSSVDMVVRTSAGMATLPVIVLAQDPAIFDVLKHGALVSASNAVNAGLSDQCDRAFGSGRSHHRRHAGKRGNTRSGRAARPEWAAGSSGSNGISGRNRPSGRARATRRQRRAGSPSSYWSLLERVGTLGATGATGATGSAGATGPTGPAGLNWFNVSEWSWLPSSGTVIDNSQTGCSSGASSATQTSASVTTTHSNDLIFSPTGLLKTIRPDPPTASSRRLSPELSRCFQPTTCQAQPVRTLHPSRR